MEHVVMEKMEVRSVAELVRACQLLDRFAGSVERPAGEPAA
jgi:hypothetical protein